jgi:hypothetical protein
MNEQTNIHLPSLAGGPEPKYRDNNTLGVGPWIVQECGRGGTRHVECKTEMEAKAFAKALCAKQGRIVAVCQVRYIYERLAVTEHVVTPEGEANEAKGGQEP